MSAIYQFIVRQWRTDHFTAMFRFPLIVALRQQRAVWEADGIEMAGPTYAEAYAARVSAAAERQYLATRYRRRG